MSNENHKPATPEEKKEGYDVNQVTFDENGNVDGLDMETLDDVAGGGNNGSCPSANVGSCHSAAM
jgi:hypothetical protein